jgi:hypothetical protein
LSIYHHVVANFYRELSTIFILLMSVKGALSASGESFQRQIRRRTGQHHGAVGVQLVQYPCSTANNEQWINNQQSTSERQRSRPFSSFPLSSFGYF